MLGLRRRRAPSPPRSRDVLELTCVVDGQCHAVPTDAFASAASAQEGTCRAVCGHPVTSGSMAAPPGPACPACRPVA